MNQNNTDGTRQLLHTAVEAVADFLCIITRAKAIQQIQQTTLEESEVIEAPESHWLPFLLLPAASGPVAAANFQSCAAFAIQSRRCVVFK